ncbi:MAG: AraC family transcriptional regulator [Sphingobium sp.]
MNSLFPQDDVLDAIGLQYWEPPEHLHYYFGSLYQFTVKLPNYSDLTRADMPQLRFMLSAQGDYQFHHGKRHPTPEICMVGPTMGATRFSIRGQVNVLGISVLPLGWLALGCESADRWVDNLYDMAAVHGPHYRDMLLRLRACADLDGEVEGLWAFLEKQLGPVAPAMIDLVSKIDQWLSENDSPKIGDITGLTGLSSRQLARYTNRLYGASPKFLARKYRALRCASQIVLDKKSWTELCDEGSFYDQSLSSAK